MKYYILINIFYIYLSFENSILDGVYAIIFDNLYLSHNNGKCIASYNFDQNTLFRIKKIRIAFNDILYNIEEINTNIQLSLSQNKELMFNASINYSPIWSFIRMKNNSFLIKNINFNCYLKINCSNYYCDNIPLDNASQFNLIIIFNEVKEMDNNNIKELINREPIDILIKYIDLNDKKLKRVGIHQIEKDYDNEELRYSIRSILNYLPWIRKIFILMPNEKVRYFKEYNLIKEKIVYVKDKDFLGYDSSNSYAFQFRYWKMKEFGISDNIIVMDDDYFIGKKLDKNDFFYFENGKVLPLIITSNFISVNSSFIHKNCELYKKKAKMSKLEQTGDIFEYSKYLTLSFIFNIFNISKKENIFIPQFTHNAIPVNLREVKEIFELVSKSKYKNETLDCPYRIIGGLQFQIFVLTYSFIKYHRKVKNIPHILIRLENALSTSYNFPLFCINKGANHYRLITSYKAKIVMDYLFPNPSPYEIADNSIQNLSFKIIKSLDKTIKKMKKRKFNKVLNNDIFYFYIFNLFFFIIIIIKYNYRIIQDLNLLYEIIYNVN